MNTLTEAILRSVQQHPGVVSAVMLGLFLRGDPVPRIAEKGLITSPHLGALKDYSSADISGAIKACLDAGWIKKQPGYYPALELTTTGSTQILAATGGVRLVVPDEVFQAYHSWRSRRAKETGKLAYRLLATPLLIALARTKPTTLEELLAVPGLGKQRALRYQADLLAIGRALTGKSEVAR